MAAVTPAAAVSLPATDSPLPGSTFEGADGNQDDPAGDVSDPPDGVGDSDWQRLEAAGRVHHNPDANAQEVYAAPVTGRKSS